MSSSSRFALKDFKLNTCEAYCRQSPCLSSRRLPTHLGMFGFCAFPFWDCVFCAFWQLGSVCLVIGEPKSTSFQCSHFVGIVTVFIVYLCFMCFLIRKLIGFQM